MKYRTLGRTGIQVSPYALGTMMFGAKPDHDDSIRIIHRALDAGDQFRRHRRYTETKAIWLAVAESSSARTTSSHGPRTTIDRRSPTRSARSGS